MLSRRQAVLHAEGETWHKRCRQKSQERKCDYCGKMIRELGERSEVPGEGIFHHECVSPYFAGGKVSKIAVSKRESCEMLKHCDCALVRCHEEERVTEQEYDCSRSKCTQCVIITSVCVCVCWGMSKDRTRPSTISFEASNP